MKNILQTICKNSFPAILSLAFLCCASALPAQTTAFNFQGRLNDGSSPANGKYDLQFRLFDAITGGTQLGSLDRPSLTLINGIFSTQLDFGAAVFDGGSRFIEIGLRQTTTGSTTPNAYVVLGPRQQILSAPYAIRSLQSTLADNSTNAQNLGNISPAGFIQNTTMQQPNANLNISGSGLFGGNVGIGTNNPLHKLEIVGEQATNSSSSSSPAISAISTSSIAVSGVSSSGQGLTGYSTSGYGILGQSNTSYGIVGRTSGSSAAAIFGEFQGGANPGYGVYGKAVSGKAGVFGETAAGYGVYGRAVANGIGVYGEAGGPDYYAGYFAGKVNVDGNISQPLTAGGLPKAMVRLDRSGSITSCYNGVSGASTGNCGFSASHVNLRYTVDFGFAVQGRIVNVTTEYDGGYTFGVIESLSGQIINAVALYANGSNQGSSTNAPVNIIVY